MVEHNMEYERLADSLGSCGRVKNEHKEPRHG